MGTILKFLSGPFGGYAVIATAALLAGSIAYGTYQHQELKAAQASLASAQRDTEIAVNSSHSKDVTIDKQNKALQTWVNFEKEVTVAQKEAVKKLQRSQYEAFVANHKLHELEKQDYALPECVKYLSIDVTAVCPANAAGMRARQAQALGINRPSGGDPGPGR